MTLGFVSHVLGGVISSRNSQSGIIAIRPIRSTFLANAKARPFVPAQRAINSRNAASTANTTIPKMAVSVEDVLKSPKWPEKWPFSARDFSREDESDDSQFYESPRFVTHIDDAAIAALTRYYAENIPANSDILDLCSSWISHLPKDLKAKSVVGLGMNKEELKKNPQLTSFDVVDLNKSPKLPYPDNSFDVILNVVSVDYLMKPLEVFKEMERVLRPGGKAIMSFSDRMFPTKASRIWMNTNNLEHAFIVGSFFHFASPNFEPAQAVDISPAKNSRVRVSDPMFIVWARKKSNI